MDYRVNCYRQARVTLAERLLKRLEQDDGLEPTTSAWKAEVLPIKTNPALVEVDGFEPTTFCLQSRHSTN